MIKDIISGEIRHDLFLDGSSGSLKFYIRYIYQNSTLKEAKDGTYTRAS